MALIQVSAVNKTTAAANNVVTLNGVVGGSLLVVCFGFVQQTNGTVPTVSGWTAAQNPAGQSFLGGAAWVGSCIFYKENAPAGTNTATIVPGAGSTACVISAIQAEFALGLTTGSLDVSTNNAAVSGTSGASGTTGATANAYELIVSALGLVDATGTTHANVGISDPATTGYSSLGVNQVTTDNTISVQFSYKYVNATGTQAANWTWTDSSAYIGTIATFNLASDGTNLESVPNLGGVYPIIAKGGGGRTV